MRYLKLCILLVAVYCFSSCSKEILLTKNIDGMYSGTFELTSTNPLANSVPLSGPVRVNLDGINYTSTANMNYVPAGGAGKFFIKKDVITFTDIQMHTANFDWNLLLTGSYAYKIDEGNITLIKKIGYNTYTYRLKKQ
jgi:hypothetical protein